MPYRIQFDRLGGPEVLTRVGHEPGAPGPGELRMCQHAVGLNFIDVYVRTGLYPVPALPSSLGTEGAGVVEAVGAGVGGFKPGDRVAYATGPLGAYSDVRVMPAAPVVQLPAGISFEQGAAIMLKGLTVWYLLRKTHRAQPGETVLWHAAAGGVGLLACQWAKALGVRLIGVAGSATKAELARAHGAWAVIDSSREDTVQRVLELTEGRKLPVVYDSVGKATWETSLDCLAPLGLMVSFGNASGPVSGVNLGTLAQKGSLYVTRPTLGSYVARREQLEEGSRELFGQVLSGAITVEIGQRYALADAGTAHAALESRATTGSTVLVP